MDILIGLCSGRNRNQALKGHTLKVNCDWWNWPASVYFHWNIISLLTLEAEDTFRLFLCRLYIGIHLWEEPDQG